MFKHSGWADKRGRNGHYHVRLVSYAKIYSHVKGCSVEMLSAQRCLRYCAQHHVLLGVCVCVWAGVLGGHHHFMRPETCSLQALPIITLAAIRLAELNGFRNRYFNRLWYRTITRDRTTMRDLLVVLSHSRCGLCGHALSTSSLCTGNAAFHLMSVGLVLYVNTGCHGVLSSSIADLMSLGSQLLLVKQPL